MSPKTEIYWIGGGSGAGKSTVARRIAAETGLPVYSTDDAMRAHARRSGPDTAPYLAEFLAMDRDERWVNRSPSEMLETFHWYRGELFDLIVEDLRGRDGPVIAEGFRLLPRLVKPIADHAVWLLPTPEFRTAVFAARGGTAWSIPAGTSDPEQALANLLDRDRLFTEHLADEVHRLALPAIEVTPGMTEDHLTRLVRQALGL